MKAIWSTETQHSQFGKIYSLSQEEQFKIIEYAMGNKVFFPEINEPSRAIKGAMVNLMWWFDQRTLGLITGHITCNHISLLLQPVTETEGFKVGSYLKDILIWRNSNKLVNNFLNPYTWNIAQKEMFTTLFSTRLTWFWGLSVEKRINEWKRQREYTKLTFVLLIEIIAKM